MSHHNEEQMSSRTLFVLGAITGVMVACTVGFFVMFGILVKGGLKDTGNGNIAARPAAAPAPSAAPSPTPSDIPPLPPSGDPPPVTADDHVLGPDDAPVTIIEYSDFECPFCGRFHPTMKQVMDDFDGDVRWIFRHFPLSFHPQAEPAANAAECAGEQGKFFEYADGLFENQQRLGTNLYEDIAEDVGLDVGAWKECFDEERYAAKIVADMNGGAGAGVTGTPGSFIIGPNGVSQLVPGALPYSQIAPIIGAMAE